MKGALVSLSVLLLGAVLAGVVYERWGERHDVARLPRLGTAIDVGGRSINLFCSGAGGPTVVLDTGAGGSGYEWVLVQPGVAQFTRACWFDRAGMGWSDPSPLPQTPANVAEDLHALLRRAGIAPPYVLAGASLGGMNMRVFAGKYPNEVSGMVLVDSATENQDPYEPRAAQGPVVRMPHWVGATLCVMAPALMTIGIPRLLTPTSIRPGPPTLSPEQWRLISALRAQPKSTMAGRSTFCRHDELLAQVRSSGTLGDRPLIVLTAGRRIHSPDKQDDMELAAFHEIWVHKLQAELLRLSNRSRQVVVPNAGHGILWDAPEAVVSAIQEVVLQARAR